MAVGYEAFATMKPGGCVGVAMVGVDWPPCLSEVE
jgi:hypothetical protein